MRLPFGSGGVAKGGTGAMVAADNLKYGNTFPAGSFSTGGMVTRPTVGLVGEAGEDEYINSCIKDGFKYATLLSRC
jgi:hypothetical protein